MSEITAVDLLRQALAGRNAKANIAILARDFIGIPIGELESFIAGHRELSPPQLDLLADFLFDASYDADRNRLRPLHKVEPVPLGRAPTPVELGAPLAVNLSGAKGPQPVGKKSPPSRSPAVLRRPGWVE
jgi:hypothetical protein